MNAMLGDAERARLLLREAGFRFSRSLGQNFLLNDAWNERIAALAGVGAGANVLEIGPGAGTLTAALARRGARILAVEIDRALESVLRAMLEGYPEVRLLFADITKQDIPALIDGFAGADAPYRLVSNLPYAAAARILPELVSCRRPPEGILAMVQKEAAERMRARPGEKDWCALAARMQYFGTVEIVDIVPPGLFTPNAHVESALISCRRYAPEERPARPRSERRFLACLEAAFAMRRKTYANNLAAAFGISRAAAAALLEEAGIAANARGETLTLAELGRVSDAVEARLR